MERLPRQAIEYRLKGEDQDIDRTNKSISSLKTELLWDDRDRWRILSKTGDLFLDDDHVL